MKTDKMNNIVGHINELKSKKLFIITSTKEDHYTGYSYKNGLNILKNQFDLSFNFGFCFTDAENILNWLNRVNSYSAVYLRTIYLPFDHDDFNILKYGLDWYANKIILAKRLELSNISTYEYLESIGVDIEEHSPKILVLASTNGNWTLVRKIITKFIKQNFLLLEWCAQLENSFLMKEICYKKDDWIYEVFCTAIANKSVNIIEYLIINSFLENEVHGKSAVMKHLYQMLYAHQKPRDIPYQYDMWSKNEFIKEWQPLRKTMWLKDIFKYLDENDALDLIKRIPSGHKFMTEQ